MVGTSRPARSVAHALRNAGAQGRMRSPWSRVTQSPSSPKGPLPAPHPRHARVPFFSHVAGHFSAHTGLYVSLLNFIADLG